MANDRTFHRRRQSHPAYYWPVPQAVEEPPIVYLPEGSQSLPSRAPRARRAAAEAYWHRIWPEPDPVNLPEGKQAITTRAPGRRRAALAAYAIEGVFPGRNTVEGPYCVHIGQVWAAGMAAEDEQQDMVGEVFVPGVHVGQLACEDD